MKQNDVGGRMGEEGTHTCPSMMLLEDEVSLNPDLIFSSPLYQIHLVCHSLAHHICHPPACLQTTDYSVIVSEKHKAS